MAKKENEKISFEKIENRFIVSHNWNENNDGKDYKYFDKRYYAKTANDTKNKMIDIQSKMSIN